MPSLTTEHDKLQTLVQALREKLGPCSGIDSEDVDPHELQQLMEGYVSDESEWAKYYFPSSTIPYTRNLVDKGNGKSNLLLLVWGPDKGSPIHDRTSNSNEVSRIHGSGLLNDEATSVADLRIDASTTQETRRHANAHCIMKILKGSLVETRFAWPTQHLNNSEDRPLDVISEKAYEENQVTYMSDKLGLHRIKNPDPNDYAVSLHLYTPPNAAVYGCNTFDEKTGHVRHMKQCAVFSEYGHQVREQRP